MKKTAVRSLVCISTAVLLLLPTVNLSHAASPQKNNEEIVKALEKMQEGLRRSTAQNPAARRMPGPHKHKAAQTEDSISIKSSRPAEGTANRAASALKAETGGEATAASRETRRSKNYGSRPLTSAKRTVLKAEHTGKAVLHSRGRSRNKMTAKRGSAASSGIITSISLKNNGLDIGYRGKVKFNILQEPSRNIVALDIISPLLLPPQFSSHIAVKLVPPSENGNIKYAVAYLHSGRKDRLQVLYHRPFLRISLYLKRFGSYRVVQSQNILNLSVGNSFIGSRQKKAAKRAVMPELKKPAVQKGKEKPPIPYTSKAEAESLPISLKSISRIVSPYPVKRVIYSREQRIQIEVDGKNIYIKPLPTRLLLPDGSFVLQYSTEPKDIYIITDKKVYSLHLIPREIPSVTYRLKPAEETCTGTLKAVRRLFLSSIHGGRAARPRSNGYISQIVYLLEAVYTGDLPPGYTMLPLKNGFSVDNKYSVTGEYEISTASGSVDVYKVTAMKAGSADERDFVSRLGKVSAVMILDRQLSKGESTYLYAVYMGVTDEE